MGITKSEHVIAVKIIISSLLKYLPTYKVTCSVNSISTVYSDEFFYLKSEMKNNVNVDIEIVHYKEVLESTAARTNTI